VRLLLRWGSNCVAIFLALYLLDSVSSGGFHVKAWWVALVAGVLLGLFNSSVRPRSRVRTKPVRLLVWVIVIVFVNALVVQILVWAGSALTTRSMSWTVAAGVFVAAVTRLISWLVGFDRGGTGAKETASTGGRQPSRPHRPSQTPSATRRGP
jgi:uncharacterized membrane protein YvlD (DUF360 family)